jgi:hypothetical protein
VNAIATFFDNLFGNMAVTFGRMAAVVLGIPLPAKQVTGCPANLWAVYICTRNIKIWSDDTNFGGQQEFTSFNFCRPTEFCPKYVFRVNTSRALILGYCRGRNPKLTHNLGPN